MIQYGNCSNHQHDYMQQDRISEVEEVGSDREGTEDTIGREDGVGDGTVMAQASGVSGTVSCPTKHHKV
jgi:hypothetical protein